MNIPRDWTKNQSITWRNRRADYGWSTLPPVSALYPIKSLAQTWITLIGHNPSQQPRKPEPQQPHRPSLVDFQGSVVNINLIHAQQPDLSSRYLHLSPSCSLFPSHCAPIIGLASHYQNQFWLSIAHWCLSSHAAVRQLQSTNPGILATNHLSSHEIALIYAPIDDNTQRTFAN